MSDEPTVVMKASHLVPWHGHELELEEVSTYGARKLIADTRFTLLLATDARQRAITRVFGVAPEDQSRAVTVVLCGSAVAVAWDALARLVPHPNTVDLEIGSTLVFLAARGLAGIPAGTVPLAGAAIALALAFRAGNNARREFRVTTRELRAAFRHRYGHLIALQPRNGEPPAHAERLEAGALRT